MGGLILDTHEAVKELVDSGMPKRQAEVVVRQLVRVLKHNLAIKAETDAVREAFRQEPQG